ncbi:MAG: hypothetical protein IVW52_05230 [Acidimicrobiales bacterium]|nr:hypothetical protein [Acidimicrobiales bacterium]
MGGILGFNLLQTAPGGGILSKLTSGGGALSTAVGPLQTRMASIQAAGTPQDKIKALTGTLGMRLRTPGGLLAGLRPTPSATGPAADSMRYQGSSAARIFASPTPPHGIEFG